MGVQMTSLGDQTRRGMSREDAQSWGATPWFSGIPAVPASLGVRQADIGMSGDLPKGMDMPFGVSGASCGHCNVSHAWDMS